MCRLGGRKCVCGCKRQRETEIEREKERERETVWLWNCMRKYIKKTVKVRTSYASHLYFIKKTLDRFFSFFSMLNNIFRWNNYSPSPLLKCLKVLVFPLKSNLHKIFYLSIWFDCSLCVCKSGLIWTSMLLTYTVYSWVTQ